MPFLLLAGPLHAITFFSLSTLIVSMILACVGTFLGKLRKASDYEVSRQPGFPPQVLLVPGHTALGRPPEAPQ